jgi:uncharacterized protein (TIGR02145 family)
MNKLALLFVFVQSLVFANNPVITLNGDSVVELYLNTYYDDPGATAFDAEDGDLSDSIVVTGTYNGSSVGSYVLAYSVTDSDGNETVKNRIINVVQEYREGFEISATHSSTDENGNGVLDVSDTILFSITLENTGNSFLGGYFNSYNLVNFNGNNLSLNEFQWGSYDLNVGTTLIYSAEYTISESTADSGGIEFSVTSIANQLTVTSNTLRIPFASTSDEIILDGQISANNNQIKKVADPTDNLDAVNKRYVDQRTLEQTIPGQNIGDLLYWNGQSWQKLSAPQDQSTLRFCEGQLTWGPCKVKLLFGELEAGSDYVDVEVLVVSNGSFISEIGLYVSTTNQMPNENDINHYENEGLDFDKSFSLSASPNTTYFVRAYAINNESLEKSYSEVITITTASEDQNGNTIYSKTYGNQEWSTKSANVTTYRDGTPIPQVTDPEEWANLTTGAWCYPNNQNQWTGKLYNWYAVAGINDNNPNTPTKEFAPEGWHVPTDAEWSTLENYLIDNGYNYDGTTTGNKIAKAMASDWDWSEDDSLGAVGNNQSLNNRSGFNAFPLGYRGYWEQGSFINKGNQALFWSSTSNNSVLAWYFRLSFNLEFSDLTPDDSIWKQGGMQVRFVKD